jgi:hypothetical protein
MRIAHTPPVACASCFAQYPDKVHVDFESTWDGPVINNDGTNYSVDDLVICEDCMRAAYGEAAQRRRERRGRTSSRSCARATSASGLPAQAADRPGQHRACPADQARGPGRELAEAAQPKRRPRPKAAV